MMASNPTARMPRTTSVLVLEGSSPPPERPIKAFFSAAVTLTLGILGSSVLPVPFAFSRTGLLLGLLVSLMVALANALTGTLILRAAGHVGAHTFETLAQRAAGSGWKLVTEVSLVFLLFGTLCGDYALLADCGKRTLLGLFPDHPAWMSAGDGRVPMVALGLFIVFPLSCMRRIRSLEYAAMAGVGLVFIVAGVIMHAAISAGFPALRSGEFPLAKVSFTSDLPEAVAVLSFAFYVQPMLLPLLKEMPEGNMGVDLTCKATQLVTIVVASLVYAAVGVFAAARYGLGTEGDVLVNHWLPGRWDGALDGLVAIYLSLSMVPMVMTMRYQLDSLITGDYAPYFLRREMTLTIFSLLTSLAVALKWPTAAEKMFAVTGATAVCLVCYVIPVAIHLNLYFRGARWHRLGSFCFQPVHSTSGGLLTVAEEGSMDSGAVAVTAWPQLRAGGTVVVGSNGKVRVAVVVPEGGEAAAGADGPQLGVPAIGKGSPRALPSQTSPAQPLPVQGPRGGRGETNISLDQWLPASRSKGASSSAESTGYETLPYSPPFTPSSRGGRGSFDSQGAPTPHAQQAQQAQHASAEPLSHPGAAGRPLPPRPATPQPGGSLVRREQQQLSPPEEQQQLSPPEEQQQLLQPLLGSSGSSSDFLQYKASGAGSWVPPYPSAKDLAGRSVVQQALLLTRHVVLPVIVMIMGTTFSLGALWVSVAALFK